MASRNSVYQKLTELGIVRSCLYLTNVTGHTPRGVKDSPHLIMSHPKHFRTKKKNQYFMCRMHPNRYSVLANF